MATNARSDSGNDGASRLDAQLVDADGFLARSLGQEERGRRQKQRWLLVICCMLAGLGALALLNMANNRLFASDKSAEGWTLWRQRRLPEAEAKFREALMENDKDGDAWTGLGWSLTNVGRTKEGMDAFKKALAVNPENASAQNGLGQCALGTGDLAVAEEYLKKSADASVKLIGGEAKLVADNIPAAWFGLVRVYLLKDDFDQAKQWADRIAKFAPDHSELKSMQKQIADRDSSETKRLLGNPAAGGGAADKHAQAWNYWNSGKPDKAIPLFRELVQADPKDVKALNGLGWALFRTGNAKEAQEAFTNCLNVSPTEIASLNGAGQCALALRDYPKAEELLLKCSDEHLKQYSQTPLSAQNLPVGWYVLVRLYLVQAKYDKATEFAQRILQYDANNDDVKKLLENARKKDNSQVKRELGIE